MRNEWVHRYIPIIILLTLVSLSLFMIKSYIVPIIGALILTYLVYPVHKKLQKKLPSWLSASITLAGTILIILLPLVLIIKEIVSQIYTAIQSGTISRIITQIESLNFVQKYNINISDLTNKFFDFGVNILSNITLSVASSIISLFIMGFIMYYLLLNWPKFNSNLRKYLPFDNKNKMISDIANTTKKIIRGTLFLALIESIVAATGFWLAGIESYLLLSILIGLFAFIPGGPAIVWAPALIIKIIQGDYISSGVILLFGLFISIYIDTILRTKIGGKDSRISPIIMLLGIMGGTPLMGLAGIIVGPLLLSYTLEILEEILNQH